jgi:ELWxxDGT repeat protein
MPSYLDDTGYQLDPIFGMYDGLISQFTYMGYEKSSSLISFAYPWYGKGVNDRNDLADLANDLKVRLDGWWTTHQAPAYVRTDSFDFVAHSTGGLITRYYGSKLGGTSKMHSVFFVGTPHTGAPLAYATYEGLDTLQGDYEWIARQAFNALAIKAKCYTEGPSNPVVQDIDLYAYIHGHPCAPRNVHTGPKPPLTPQPGMPLLHDLLPIGTSFYIRPPGQPDNLILQDLHTRLGTFINEVSVYGHVFSMYSKGKQTIQWYNVHQDLSLAPLWEGGTRVPNGWIAGSSPAARLATYTQNDNGDDTVPVSSGNLALLSHSPNVIDISPLASIRHEDYFNTQVSLKNIISNLLKVQPGAAATDADVAAYAAFMASLPDMWIDHEPHPITTSDPAGAAEGAIAYFVNACPVAMLITDPQGRQIGTTPSGETINEIPGGYYSGHDTDGGPDFILFPATTGQYIVTIAGLEPGDFRITGEVVSSTLTTRLGLWSGSLAPGEVMTQTTPLYTSPSHQRILVVDDEAGTAITEVYTTTLQSQGRTPDVWSVAQQGLPTVSDLYPYHTVVWETGNSTAFSTTSAYILNAFVNLGGNVLLSGEDVDESIGQTDAFTRTVHTSIPQTITDSRLVSGDDLLAGLTVSLNGGTSADNQDSPSVLAPFADATPLAFYADGADRGKPAALRYATSIGKLVYLGFGVEGIQTDNGRTHLMDRIFTWFEDGTGIPDAQPHIVKDVNPGSASATPTASQNTATISGTLFYIANDGTHGNELWKSDGTEAGTVMVKDINTGGGNSNPGKMVVLNNTLYFAANDGIHGNELWKSDGTQGETTMVNDTWPGSSGGGASPISVLSDTLIFNATDGLNGIELWTSDGTEAGTGMLKDVVAGAGSSNPTNFTVSGPQLFFSTTAASSTAIRELWTSDGTANGTVFVKALSGSSLANMTATVDGVFFTLSTTTSGTELWHSNGTDVGTILVKDIAVGTVSSSPSNMTILSDTLYFTANNGINGIELWRSDGTSNGTTLVKDINPGASNASPLNLTPMNGTLFFSANNGVNGSELWRSDGTDAGTILVKDINPGSAFANPSTFSALNGVLFFRATDGIHGSEQWQTDGTPDGTLFVKDIYVGPLGSSMTTPVAITTLEQTTLFFMANNGIDGTELWTLSQNTY